MKNVIVLLIILVFPFSKMVTAATPKLTFGTELDALPYLSGGYYGSVGVGHQNYRLRGILTQTFPPKFVTPNGFENYELQVFAVIVDYFFGNKAHQLEGVWVGTGLEFWKTTVTNTHDQKSGTFRNQIFTVGGGYVWRFYKKLYLNPWLAGHLLLGKPTEPQIGNRCVKIQRFTPEASLKIGFYF